MCLLIPVKLSALWHRFLLVVCITLSEPLTCTVWLVFHSPIRLVQTERGGNNPILNKSSKRAWSERGLARVRDSLYRRGFSEAFFAWKHQANGNLTAFSHSQTVQRESPSHTFWRFAVQVSLLLIMELDHSENHEDEGFFLSMSEYISRRRSDSV